MNFCWISSLFSWANTFQNQEFRPKLKISNNTKYFAQHLSWQCLINMSLHHATKNKDFNFFGFRHSFRGPTPLKLKNFDQKWKIRNNTQNFAQIYSWESLINTSLLHPMKITYFKFFWISSLFFRGLTPLNLKNFDQKSKFSNKTINFAQCSSWEGLIKSSLHHAMKVKDFNFFGFRHSIRGLTPLKLKNFDQKLKISNYA